ncbi:hypothetical protein SAMN02910453_1627 [Lachnospiraceae bacterium A10]|nr:hypothetical protein SAMN02910453_1627 [Lachnospiraceae bacterium A10]
MVYYSCFLISYTRFWRLLGALFLFLLSLHHSTACFWCTILVFALSTPLYRLLLVYNSYFFNSYTRFWQLLGALFLFSRFLHQILATSWCTILVFSIPTPGTIDFLVYYSCFLDLYTKYQQFPGVQFFFLLSLHHSPAYSWCTILVFALSTPLSRLLLVHNSCFLDSYTKYQRFLGALF